ncbi:MULTISPECIES: tyrosine-type recombinase/integrase [unclassified Shewanella]|uniref:tyrosine-type recombinase/integrase n=1 Tax=unclassified Shewanella TaxID=196818 RepID=UPI00355071F4
MAKNLQMNFASVMTFHGNGKPQSLTKYDSGNNKSDTESAIKHSLELDKINYQHRVTCDSVEAEEGGMKLSEAIEEYREWRSKKKPVGSKVRGLGDKVSKSRFTNLNFLLLCIGDKEIKSITRADIKAAMLIAANMPKRNIKPYSGNKDLSVWVEAARAFAIPEDDLISSKSVKEILKDFQSLFSTFLTNEKGVLDSSPTMGVTIEVESQSYANFSKKQMKSIVKYWKNQPDTDFKWIALLGAYTGARRGDIFGLKFSSIKLDKECGRFYLFIEEGKTSAARRKIPLHKKLIKMGFLKYIKKIKKNKVIDSKVFYSFSNPENITCSFYEALRSIGIPKVNDELRRFVFHSLRHSVITEAMKSNELHLVQRVVGHELSGAGITKRYTGEFELKDYLSVIDCLDW